MPLYFFNLFEDSRLIAEAERGYDCPNDEAAREFARFSNGLITLNPFLTTTVGTYRIEVRDEAGQSIFVMPVSK